MFVARFFLVLAALVLASLFTDMQPVQAGPADWYAARGAVAPRSDRVIICHGYGCVRRNVFQFTAGEIAKLRRILAAGRQSPAAERAAISTAVRWFENRMRTAFDYPRDEARSPIGLAGEVGQMDCIDEATNTTSLLLIARSHDLLVHHRVLTPVARGFFLDGRGPHVTAVVAERQSNRRFAVDSWVDPGGADPKVMPLKQWLAERTISLR